MPVERRFDLRLVERDGFRSILYIPLGIEGYTPPESELEQARDIAYSLAVIFRENAKCVGGGTCMDMQVIDAIDAMMSYGADYLRPFMEEHDQATSLAAKKHLAEQLTRIADDLQGWAYEEGLSPRSLNEETIEMLSNLEVAYTRVRASR